MNSRRGLNPRKEPYCKICELYLARADAAHSPKASTGNASVAGTPLVNAIMLRASWMCLICSLYFLQDHEDCRDEQYCVDELDEAFTADVAVRDVSQQGAERKERQRRQDKPPWHAGQLVAQDNICNCLLYTSDAADDLLCVDLGGRRIIKKKKKKNKE